MLLATRRVTATWLILLMALGGGCSGDRPRRAAADTGGEQAGAPASTVPAVADEWLRFRQTYPLHIQGVALSPPAPGGDRTLIVAEPPPWVTLEDLRSVSPIFDGAQVRSNVVGHDGWTKDVVTTLPAGVDERELLTALHRLMFGTSYKAAFLPVTLATPSFSWNEVTPSGFAVAAWFAGNTQRAASFLDEEQVAIADLLDARRAGVYRVDSGELVLWVLPKAGLDTAHRDARIFAVESDLILGGIGGKDAVIFVARTRALPIEHYPPLRFECLQALASVKGFSVAQSFERTSPGAGNLASGADFAPILLSPEVIDTEIGSTLNIADQLLKGWSQHGEATYENFDHPPASYPLDQAVTKELDAEVLTFNWNTADYATLAELSRFKAVGFSHTGALPITYLPGQQAPAPDAPAIKIATRVRAHFAGLGDPWLIRANQYAAAYHVLSLFAVKTARIAPAADRRIERVRAAYVRRAVDRFASVTDQEIKAAIDELNEHGTPDPDGAAEMTEMLQMMRSGFATMPPRDRGKIASAIIDGKLQALAEDPVSAMMMERVLLLFLQRDAFMAELVALAAEHPTTWIHTPAVVVSSNAAGDGGHNLDVLPNRLKTSADMVRGSEPTLAKNGVLYANESDFLEAANRETSLRAALGYTAPTPATGDGWQGGTRAASGDPARMVVERQASGYRAALHDDAGNLLHERTVATVSDAIDLFEAHATSPRAPIRELELAGFDEGGRDAFVRTARLRDHGRVRVAMRGESALDLSALHRRYDFKSLELVKTTIQEAERGAEAVFEVAARAREPGTPGLIVRIKAWFRNQIPAQLQAKVDAFSRKVRGIVKRWRGGREPRIDVLAAEIQRELRTIVGDDLTLRIEVIEGPDGTLIVKVTAEEPQPA